MSLPLFRYDDFDDLNLELFMQFSPNEHFHANKVWNKTPTNPKRTSLMLNFGDEYFLLIEDLSEIMQMKKSLIEATKNYLILASRA